MRYCGTENLEDFRKWWIANERPRDIEMTFSLWEKIEKKLDAFKENRIAYQDVIIHRY